jgi:hypothetical protein
VGLPAIIPARPIEYAGPHSGRLIWTGSLARRGVVEIENGRPSVGALAGSLPGVAVAIQVAFAEFASAGVVAYTNDARANGRQEPASAVNGWNATHFEWNPRRAGQIVVLESPNPSNEFKRLALRSDAPKCTMILIDWRTQ